MADSTGSGPWADDCWSIVDGIRESNDVEHVVSFIAHKDSPVRLAVAEWFGLGKVERESLNKDSRVVRLTRPRPPMPDDVATILGRDSAPTVAGAAVMRANDTSLLFEVALDPNADPWAQRNATQRLLSLGLVDDLLDADVNEQPLPMETNRAVAEFTDRTDVLATLLEVVDLREPLLANPNLSSKQRAHLLGVISIWRPDDAASWAEALQRGSKELAEIAEWQEVRKNFQATGHIFTAASELCSAAAQVLDREAEGPEWVHDCVTWALELTRYVTDRDSTWAHLDITPNQLTSDHIPNVEADDLRGAGLALQMAARTAEPFENLANAAADLLDALASPDRSLNLLACYGSSGGYDDFHLFEILALRTSDELRFEAKQLSDTAHV